MLTRNENLNEINRMLIEIVSKRGYQEPDAIILKFLKEEFSREDEPWSDGAVSIALGVARNTYNNWKAFGRDQI